MSTQAVNNAKAGAEVYHGRELCKHKALELLDEMGLPRGLLPLHGLEQFGHVRATGFVWLKRKKKLQYHFKTIGNLVCYAPEVITYTEKYRMRKASGVKVKELLMWISMSGMAFNDPPKGTIYCQSALGIGMSFPVQAFEMVCEK